MHCSAARFVSTDRHRRHFQVLAWCALLLTLAEPSLSVDRVAPDRVAPDRVRPDRVLTRARGQARSASAAPAEPTAFSGFSKAVDRKLRLSFQVAVQRLHAVETCRGLFADLGADGFEILSRTIYAPPHAEGEQVCARRTLRSPAWAQVTRLCNEFGYLHRNEAAMVLIHEGLHRAGLAERPLTDARLSSQDINRMVIRACRL